MERFVDEIDFVATPDYYMDWIEGGSLVANPPWEDDTKTGAYGVGSHGTAEKGRLWFEAAINKSTHSMSGAKREERMDMDCGENTNNLNRNVDLKLYRSQPLY